MPLLFLRRDFPFWPLPAPYAGGGSLHKFHFIWGIWIGLGFYLTFFAEFAAPFGDTGLGYSVLGNDAFIGAAFLLMETNDFLFKFGCVVL